MRFFFRIEIACVFCNLSEFSVNSNVYVCFYELIWHTGRVSDFHTKYKSYQTHKCCTLNFHKILVIMGHFWRACKAKRHFFYWNVSFYNESHASLLFKTTLLIKYTPICCYIKTKALACKWGDGNHK